MARHAILAHRRGRWNVKDLDSTNGTFVNGRRVRNSSEIKNGDVLRFGAVAFSFRAAGPSRGKRWVAAAVKVSANMAAFAGFILAVFIGVMSYHERSYLGTASTEPSETARQGQSGLATSKPEAEPAGRQSYSATAVAAGRSKTE